jgi:WD40 repeat protein
MGQSDTKPVIDFTSYIADRSRNFTGREWIFKKVHDWLAKRDGPRFFLLTGEPGSGKTAIAAQLSLFSQGAISPPEGLTRLAPGFLSAFHFCSARDRHWISPHVFAESLAIRLTRFPTYAEALAEKSGDRQIRIEVEQKLGEVTGGQVDALVIKSLNLGGVSAEDAFIRVVREPLEALFSEGFDQQIVILVDALDEALLYSGKVGIVPLLAQADNLPAGVRFILTSRQDERVENEFWDADSLSLSASTFDERNEEDIANYVQERLSHDEALAVKTTQLEPSQVIDLVGRIADKAAGNFLYVSFLLGAAARGQRTLDDLEGLPEELDGLYYDFLSRVVRFAGKNWATSYAPLLGVLSVARANLTLTQLAAFTRQSAEAVWQHLGNLEQFIEGVELREDQQGEERGYRLYHQSLIDFLRRQVLIVKEEERRNRYYLPEKEQHQRIIGHYLAEAGSLEDANWSQMDHYGLRYLPTHLLASQEFERLEQILTNLVFIASKCSAGLVDDLLRDFEAYRMVFGAQWDEERPISQFSRFVSHTAHLLRVSPDLCYQEAFNSSQQHVRRAAVDILHGGGFPKVPWLRKTAGAIRQHHSGQVISMAFWGEDRYLAVSTTEREVWVWDTALGDLWRRCETPPSAAKTLVVSPNGEFLAAGFGAAEPDPLISGVMVWTRDGQAHQNYRLQDWVYTICWRNDSEFIIGAGLPAGSEAAGTLWQANLSAPTCEEIGRYLADCPMILTWDPLPGQHDQIMALSMDGIVYHLTSDYVPLTPDERHEISMQLLSDGDYDAHDARLAERRPISHRLPCAPCVDTFGYYTVAQAIGLNQICMLGEPPVPPEVFGWHTPNPDGIYVFDFEQESSSRLQLSEVARSGGFKAICLAATSIEQSVAIGTSHGQMYIFSVAEDSNRPEMVHQGRYPVTAVCFSQSGRHIAVGDAGAQFAVYDRATRSLVFGTERTEMPVAARVKDSQVLLLYSDRLEMSSVDANEDNETIPLVEDLLGLDFDFHDNLAVILCTSASSQETDGRRYVQIIDLSTRRVVLCVDIPVHGPAMLEPNMTSEAAWSVHKIRLHMDEEGCSIILGSVHGLIAYPLLAFENGRTFVLPKSAVERQRPMTVIRIDRDVPEISCEVFAIASEKVAIVCGYADNADHPNISGEIRVWNLLTAEYSASQHFSSSIRSLESTSDGTIIVGTDHGEASSWRFDGEWRRLAGSRHPVTVAAVACAGDRQLACSASRDGLLIIWHFLSGTPLFRTYVDVQPVSVGFLHQGQSLCMVDQGGEVHVWEIEGYDKLPDTDYRIKESIEYASTLVQQYLNAAAHLSRVQELYNRGQLNAAKLVLEALPDVANAQEIQQYWEARLDREPR